MGYVIRYGGKTRQERQAAGKVVGGIGKFAIVLVAIALLIRVAIPNSRELFRKLLVPGMPDSAAHAFSQMILNMRQGMRFPQAMDTFCQEIITNAIP